jgi:uncharacterized membrane protein
MTSTTKTSESRQNPISTKEAFPRRSIILLLLSVLVVSASRGLFSSYSYWGDEIFSVFGSELPWKEMLSQWILQGDTHPPLYHALLKLWMNLFGSSELATRFFSFLCGTVALITLAVYTRKRSFTFQLIAVAWLGTIPATATYMQETRSYALLLLVALAAMIFALELRRQHSEQQGGRITTLSAYYITCLTLSLTHYFGWIYVFILTAINLLERVIDSKRWRSLLFLALISIWPLVHVVFGTLGSRTGGNFWIKLSIPVLGTINNMLTTLSPLILISKEPNRLLLLLFTCAFVWRYASTGRTGSQSHANTTTPDIQSLSSLRDKEPQGSLVKKHLFPMSEPAYLAATIILLPAFLILIDLKTPMSVPRYYIVLLPSAALLVASFFDSAIVRGTTKDRHFLVAVAMALLVVQLYASQLDLRERAWPRENWKGLAKAVRASDLCREGCYSNIVNTYFIHYFRSLPLRAIPTVRPQENAATNDHQLMDLLRTGKPLILGGGELSIQNTRTAATEANYLCLVPQQRAEAPFALVPEPASAVLLNRGLIPCP